jgi:hypothetical protein
MSGFKHYTNCRQCGTKLISGKNCGKWILLRDREDQGSTYNKSFCRNCEKELYKKYSIDTITDDMHYPNMVHMFEDEFEKDMKKNSKINIDKLKENANKLGYTLVPINNVKKQKSRKELLKPFYITHHGTYYNIYYCPNGKTANKIFVSSTSIVKGEEGAYNKAESIKNAFEKIKAL